MTSAAPIDAMGHCEGERHPPVGAAAIDDASTRHVLDEPGSGSRLQVLTPAAA